MSLYLLDTEHIGILQRRTEPACTRIQTRMASIGLEVFSVSIVSFHEQFRGWAAHLNSARSSPDIVFGYQMLQLVIAKYTELPVVSYDERAADEFARLRKLRLRVGTIDLRIASIALVNQLTVLTRNLVDFQRIPGVRCEDWSGA